MSVPRLEIDRSIGAAYIRFTGEPTERTVELSGSINVDLDVNGSPVGVEILNYVLPEPQTVEFDCRGWRCRDAPNGDDICCPSCDCSIMNSTVSTERVDAPV